MFLRMLCLLGLALLAGSPASAFGDCTSAAYLAAFRETGPIPDCAPIALNSLTLTGVSTPVRVFRVNVEARGDDALWIARLNEILDRVSFAATALGPSLRIGPVSILLADHTNEALDDAVAFPNGVLPRRECPVVVLKTPDAHSDTDFAFIVAHELFHCIQDASWSSRDSVPGSKWWIEGTAEYFAGLVVPESNRSASFVSAFARVSQQNSLHVTSPGPSNPTDQLDLENVVFFDWLHHRGGGDAVTSFISSMPTTPTYQATLNRILPLPDWSEFVETYLASRVTDTAGRTLEPGTPYAELVLDSDSHTVFPSTDAYQVFRASVRVAAPGQYEISSDADASVRVRIRLGEREWQDLPATVGDCRTSPSAVLYMATVEGPKRVGLSYRRTGDCAPCERARTSDACLVGTWRMTGGGPVEWMRANGMPAQVQARSSDVTLRMTRAGDFIVNPVSTDIQVESDGMTVTGTGQSAGIAGHWGTADGVLHVCPVSGETQVNVQGQSAGNTREIYQSIFGPGERIQVSYTCRGNTLTTSMPIPGLPSMQTEYTRTGR